MSTTETSERPRFPVNPNRGTAIIISVALGVGAFLFSNAYQWFEARRPTTAEAVGASPAPSSTPEAPSVSTREFEAVMERLSQLEELVRTMKEEQRRTSTAQSEEAVQSVKRLRFQGVLRSAESDLGQLRQQLSDWTALWASLEASDTGRKIAASGPHFRLFRELYHRPRPTTSEIDQAAEELSTLSSNVLERLTEDSVRLTTDHVQLLNDLGQKLSKQVAEFEDQLLLAKSIQSETARLPAGNVTLQTALENERIQQEKETLEAIQKSADEVRQRIIAQRSEELAQTEEKLATLRIEEELARKEREADELKVKIRSDKEAGEIRKARSQLEREFAKDEREVRSLLQAFTSDGYTYRTDDTKGPVSLRVIESRGGLKQTRDGLQQLFFIAKTDPDRPNKGLPEGVGGQIASATPLEPIERAQELLIKYGQLMVEKGLLAP